MKTRTVVALTIVSSALVARGLGQEGDRECPLNPLTVVDDRFHFEASSDEGAVGDVVGIDVGLVSEVPYPGPSRFAFCLCYDGAILEIVGEPQNSPELDAMGPFCEARAGVTSGERQVLRLSAVIGHANAAKYFPSPDALTIATIYFRLKGSPGDVARLEFCDAIWERSASCEINRAHYKTPSPPYARTDTEMVSRSHVGGKIRILEGPCTRPEPPPMPPLAKVYSEAPTAGVHFEISETVARPGAKGIPVAVFATSGYEFCGYALSIVYPPEHLALSGVEHHTRPGAYFFDNERGVFALAMMNSNRRIAAEGERVKLVTLRFDLKDGVDLPGEIQPRFSDFSIDERHYFNGLYIRHGFGGSIERPTTSSVVPVGFGAGALKIQREPALAGDADFDGEVTLADAVGILMWLFQGGDEVLCPPAAETNGDGRIDLSDAISILRYLFLGGSELLGGGYCDEWRGK